MIPVIGGAAMMSLNDTQIIRPLTPTGTVFVLIFTVLMTIAVVGTIWRDK